jgi:hypothetical protein
MRFLTITTCFQCISSLGKAFQIKELLSAKSCYISSDHDDDHRSSSRRQFFSAGFLAGLYAAQPPALAKDELFQRNPLTNPILEKFRIWEQAEADTLQYGGELERGDAGNKGKAEAYSRLLVPILQISKDLLRIDTNIRSGDLGAAQQLLQKPEYVKINFKKTFNAFGDNIYFSDPDRANLYLGGGATPKNEQSLAYLLRNDILTNLEALQAEVDYLLAHPDESTDDLYKYSQLANEAMQKYLEIVPPSEIARAKELTVMFNST